MEIRTKITGKECILELDGNLDETSTLSVEKSLDDALKGGESIIIFDMRLVEYVSSAGIRVLISAYKKAVKNDKKIALKNMAGQVRNVIDMVGITSLFDPAGGKP